MTREFTVCAARAQEVLSGLPYDRWIAESGHVMAEFYRENTDIRARFPDGADFLIDGQTMAVSCSPVPHSTDADIETLWHNSMLPLLDNHTGGVSLHGSACVIDEQAVGFIGASRRGKTTLAAACASAGHPFLAEDAIRLSTSDAGYDVLPARPLLRLCADSAAHLVTGTKHIGANDDKVDVPADQTFTHHGSKASLQAIYLLGDAATETAEFTALGQQEALAELMRHAFILDIEDKKRLAAHFDRLAKLARAVPCIRMDFPRRFDALSNVVKRLAADARSR